MEHSRLLATMRLNIFISLLLISITLKSFGQITQINIRIDSNRHTYKEPKKGFKTYTLIYDRNENGGLTFTKFQTQYRTKGKKISKPKRAESISKDDIDSLYNWLKSNKKSFLLRDLKLDSDVIERSIPINTLKCQPDYSHLSVIRIDSFEYCNRYPLRYGESTGTDKFNVIIFEKNDTLLSFNFRTDDLIRNKIDMQGYLTLQAFLSIPEGFEVENIFSAKNLQEVLNYYMRIEQCEGYYYSLFKEEHPERTTQENRMQIEWCFKTYLEERVANRVDGREP